MSLEATLTVMIDELKKLNENITEHNDIMLSHYAAIGELEMEEVKEDLDS